MISSNGLHKENLSIPIFGYIEYDEQSFAWRVCWQKYDPDFMEEMQQEYISVIGNIHDNPELLKNP